MQSSNTTLTCDNAANNKTICLPDVLEAVRDCRVSLEQYRCIAISEGHNDWWTTLGKDAEQQAEKLAELLHLQWLPYESGKSRESQLIALDKKAGTECVHLRSRVVDRLVSPKGLHGKVIEKYREKSSIVISGVTWEPYPLNNAFRLPVVSSGIGYSLNTYVPPQIYPTRHASITPFSQLLEHMFQDDPELIPHVLNWIAHKMQYPERKLGHAVVIAGKQGNGKTMIADTFRMLLGEHNCTTASLDQVTGPKTDFVHRKQLVVVEEVMGMTAKQHDALKAMITNQMLSYDIKYGAMFQGRNYADFMFTSNHLDGMWLNQGYERRYCMHWADVDPLPAEFYQEFVNWRDRQGGLDAIAGYLLQLDLSAFNPQMHAPRTKSLERMSEACLTGEALVIRDALDGVTKVTHPWLSETLREHDYKDKAKSPKAIAAIMERLGYVKLAKQPYVTLNGKQQRCSVVYYMPSVVSEDDAVEFARSEKLKPADSVDDF